MAAPAIWQTGIKLVTSLIGSFHLWVDTGGPTNAAIPMKGGTFTANGASTVTVSDTAVKAGSNIIITLNTPAGTVGAIPTVLTKTAGTGFTVAGTASDTSLYNYLILA